MPSVPLVAYVRNFFGLKVFSPFSVYTITNCGILPSNSGKQKRFAALVDAFGSLEVACLTGIAIAPIEAPKHGWSNKIVTKMLSDVASRLDSEGGPSVFTKMQSASYFATVWALDLDVCKLVHLHCLHCSKRFLKLLA